MAVKRGHRLANRVRMRARERKAYGKACGKRFSTNRFARYLHRFNYPVDEVNRGQICDPVNVDT